MNIKNYFFLTVILSYALVSSGQQAEYLDFWTKADAQFSNPETTPLQEADLANFDSIARYSYNAEFAVNAKFEALARQKPISFRTTGSIKQRYQKAGVIKFVIDSTSCQLTAYRNLELMRKPGFENRLFIPFTDNSNGKGTYEGGRYLEMSVPESDSTLVDFNLVYNPYCAYSDKYSCPIPPRDNHLDVGIFAGAKSSK